MIRKSLMVSMFLCLTFYIQIAFASADSVIPKAIPSQRSGYALAYVEIRKVIVLFGGQDNTDARLGDTWEWANGTWKLIAIQGPAARANATMTYDTEKKCILLYGGRSESETQSDLWCYDGKSWTRLNFSSSPPSRQLATIAYDKHNSQLVIFGGLDAKRKAIGDSWIMKNNKWIQITTAGPSARASHSMIYNARSGSIMIYGGYKDGTLNDFWELKNGSWRIIKSKNAPPRLHAAICYDTDKKRILVFGGFSNNGRTNEIWQYNGKKWTQLHSNNASIPQPRAEHEGVYIPGLGFFIFGGVIGIDPNTRNRGNDSWIYNNGSWEELK